MNSKRIFLRVACAAVFAPLALGSTLASETAGTRDEAQAMVRRAAAYVKEKGPESAYAEFVNGTAFKDRDLYISV